jgi:chromosome segregation ATPase
LSEEFAKLVDTVVVDRRVADMTLERNDANTACRKLEREKGELGQQVRQLEHEVQQAQSANETLTQDIACEKSAGQEYLKSEQDRHQSTRDAFNAFKAKHTECVGYLRKLENAKDDLQFSQQTLQWKDEELAASNQALETRNSDVSDEKKYSSCSFTDGLKYSPNSANDVHQLVLEI